MRMWLAGIGEDAKAAFVELAALSGYKLDPQDIELVVLPAPHRQETNLASGRMALYSFWQGRRACKVGMASPNDGVRFRHQHYSPGSCSSSLARSIRAAPSGVGLDVAPEAYRGWMENNLSRINFTMPASWGQPLLKLFEAFLHARWRPIYEGRAWRGYEIGLPAPDLGKSVGSNGGQGGGGDNGAS